MVKIRRIIILIAFLIVAFLFVFSQAYAYTEITNCTTITSPGEYRLVNDIIDANVESCIYIQSDNVIFDCQGHTIDGVGSSSGTTKGIFAYNGVNITVVNCRFTDWERSVNFYNVINGSILSSYVDRCYTYDGISLESSSYIRIENVSVSQCLFGVVADLSLYTTIHGISCSNVFLCIIFYDSPYGIIYNVNMLDGVRIGIYALNSSNINISSIDGYGQSYGIFLRNTSNSIISHSTLRNFYSGIFLEYSFSNKITNISVVNSSNGILMSSSDFNQINNSVLRDNYCGINISYSTNNSIFNNIFNNTNNVCFSETIYYNYWNTSITKGTNIVGGLYIGGNYWGSPDGTGYSDTCVDANYDGICDNPYTLATDNIDYLPLAKYVAPYCGNGICEPGEDYNTCPADCPAPTTTTTTIPSYGLIATARAIARINPFALFILVLIPVIIGEFVIKSFEEIKVNEPLKAAIRLLILIISLALLAAVF